MTPDDPYGFDSLSLEWLRAKPGGKWRQHPGLLAAWVADMDFPAPPVVLDALAAVVASGDLGYPAYSPKPSPVRDVFADRLQRRYGWQIDPRDTRELNDVVQGIQIVLHHVTVPGDRVVLHAPAYPPFLRSVQDHGRQVVPIPAHRSETAPTGWCFDYDALDATLQAEPAKVLLLCHPHNPTGHVFQTDELQVLADLAERHNLLIISDEIHADLTYAPRSHRPMALHAPDRTVTIHSASKAFNLAGLRYAIMHLGPVAVRQQVTAVPRHLYGDANLFGVTATLAAWTAGDEWLAAVVRHLDRQRSLLADLLREHLPEVVYAPPAATYLAWLDCRALGLGDDPSEEFARRGARLSEGPNFGSEGVGHARLNFATSSSVLREVVLRMSGHDHQSA